MLLHFIGILTTAAKVPLLLPRFSRAGFVDAITCAEIVSFILFNNETDDNAQHVAQTKTLVELRIARE